jgi:hypothetical protein
MVPPARIPPAAPNTPSHPDGTLIDMVRLTGVVALKLWSVFSFSPQSRPQVTRAGSSLGLEVIFTVTVVRPLTDTTAAHSAATESVDVQLLEMAARVGAAFADAALPAASRPAKARTTGKRKDLFMMNRPFSLAPLER